jgi:CRISPR/Cas system-associated exonuclease Cas4 (RecB family)
MQVSFAQLVEEGMQMPQDPTARVPCGTCRGGGVEGAADHPWRVGYIRPSAADHCIRRLYYDVTGEVPHEDTPSSADILARSIGNAVGHRVQHALISRVGVLNAQAEVKVLLPPALGIKEGHIDVLLTSPQGRVVVEIKTMVEATWAGLTAARSAHVLQTSLYMKAADAAWGVILVISKGYPHKAKEFQFPRATAEAHINQWVYEKRNPLQRYLDSGTAPARDVPASECKHCPYLRCPVRA